MLVGQDIAAAALMDQGGPLFQRFPGVKNAGQYLVLHFDKGFGLLDLLPGLGGHQGHGVPQIVGHVAHGDQGVPVLLQMAHLKGAGDVLRGEDGVDAGHRPGRAGVDREHPRPGMLGAQGGAHQHSVDLDVVGILAVAQDLFGHIHPVGPLAHAGDRRRLEVPAVLPDQPGGQLDGVDDLLIAGAAADIVADGEGDLVPGGIGIAVDEGLAAQDHAGDAEAALYRAGLAKGIDIDLTLPLTQSFDREDLLSLKFGDLLDAGLDGGSIHQNGTGAAGALVAAVLDGGEFQVPAQDVDELAVLRDGYGLAVDVQSEHLSCLL